MEGLKPLIFGLLAFAVLGSLLAALAGFLPATLAARWTGAGGVSGMPVVFASPGGNSLIKPVGFLLLILIVLWLGVRTGRAVLDPGPNSNR